MSINHPIYLVEASTQYQLAATFLRFQEHFESPRFRGKYFSLEEFMDWYAAAYGAFTYYDDWEGFNVPSWVFKPFRAGRFDPLSRKEKKLLDLVADSPEPFYVIGANRPFGLPMIKHELAHALFEIDPRYQRDVLTKIRKSDVRTYERALEKSRGYHRTRWPDEINAYSLAGISDLVALGLNLRQAKPLQRSLRQVFRDHFRFSLLRARKDDILRLVHINRLQL